MKRTVALGAAWTASAAAAVGLGFLAVSFVDASASPETQPLAASTSPSTASAAPTASDAPEAPAARPSATGEYVTAGGTVYANCTAGRPVVAGVPAAGWWADDSNEAGKVEFERGTQEVEVRVSCVDGSPIFVLDDSTPASSSSSSPATSTSGRDDDSDNSGHGGSGSDDSDDDSSGRGGDDDSSGHGGDDSSGHGGSDDD
jgi:hypothetical protein